MNDYRYDGVIREGEFFEWGGYGCEGWPHAYQQIVVTEIIDRGDERIIASKEISPLTRYPNQHATAAGNEEEHFRTHVRRLPTSQ